MDFQIQLVVGAYLVFIGKLKVEKLPYKKAYLLKQPLQYESSKYGNYTIPTNFCTDFASVPNLLQWWIKPQGLHSKPSVLHDYLYSERKFSKFKADFIFLEAMKECGVNYKRYVMFIGVFLFGMFFKKGQKI